MKSLKKRPSMSRSRSGSDNTRQQSELSSRAFKNGMKNDLSQLKKDVQNGFDLLTQDRYGRTVLMYAAMSGHEDMIEYILSEKGMAALEQTDSNGLSALHWACNTVTVKVEIITLLTDKGASLEQEDNGKNTPLIYCMRARNNVATVSALLKMGANVDHKNEEGKSALDICEAGAAGDVKVPNRNRLLPMLRMYSSITQKDEEITRSTSKSFQMRSRKKGSPRGSPRANGDAQLMTVSIATQTDETAFIPQRNSVLAIFMCQPCAPEEARSATSSNGCQVM
mmetsp:Transcript_38558/g.49168  ORF Transcript_38558/g.49168 Transcript_38558/m.49168 type:complete len:281 (-) Transcript_38558:434-1276(-)